MKGDGFDTAIKNIRLNQSTFPDEKHLSHMWHKEHGAASMDQP
jgi:hypothetical protein